VPKVLAFAGSFREHSYNRRVLKVVADGAKRSRADVDILDLREYPLPIFNADEVAADGFPPKALEFQELICKYDGLIIASPEYNGSVPGGMKNTIDWASRKSEKFGVNEVFKNKCAAIVTASPGSFGGIRCLAHLRGILSIMGVNVLPSEIAVTFVAEKFEGDSWEMKDEKTKALLEGLGAALTDMLIKVHGKVKFISDTSA
jgi:chromate reductase